MNTWTKKIKMILLAGGMLWFSLATGQGVTPEVIASAGSSVDVEGYNYSWTVGETAIWTLEQEGFSLLQGFHQPEYFLDVKAVAWLPEQAILFPNPTGRALNIKMPPDTPGGSVMIFDLTGKTVLQCVVSSENKVIDVTHIPAGSYVVKITTRKKGPVLIAKLIKI